ncbi:hypothetical protein NQ315_002177 [Exocentrus adspersus]|uniref:Multidrug resistance-associated protein lethal(2)03659 n=1 Tax=Exocentrus adspersus TaxID=1586481 RepID=A0AAV8VZ72_9CUCU|nr:hypothetical protein NQ315_002177 [Exocentrus adspersus]
MDSSKKYDTPSPEETTNIVSKIFFCESIPDTSTFFFSWIIPFFKHGYKNDLQLKDIYNATGDDMCGPLAEKLERNWADEVKTAGEKKDKPSLRKAIFKTFVRSYSLYGVFLFIQVIILKSLQPIVLAEYIRYFDDTNDIKGGTETGWILGSAVVLLAFLNILMLHHAQLGCQRIGMRVRAACCSLVYRKLLKLSQASLGQTAAGQLVNLLSNDLQRFDTASLYLHYIWIMPLQAVIAFYLMYRSVGIAALAGMAAMAIEALPLQVDAINNGHEVVKVVASTRGKNEIDAISKTSYIRGFSLSLMVFTERLALYLTLIAFVLLGHKLSSDIVFSMAQLFNSIQLYMCIYYPHALANFAEAKVSIKRLEEFLVLEENGTRAVLSGGGTNKKTGTVKVEKATASWTLYPVTDTLMDINLEIAPGTLCCVVGNVGAGKSSLLQMLLRELPLNCGKVDVSGTMSYASQVPWLFVSSVRDNILFGKPYVKARSAYAFRYDEVVKVCALERDFEQFAFGDKTLVEERGVSLSGGQRARINLARAIYAQADIYLLDDPLSAVDTHVGKHLFEECIKKYLQGKTRVLVTHQLQFLKQADLIVIMNNGRVTKAGSFSELSEDELSSLYPETTQEEKEKHQEDDNGKAMAVPGNQNALEEQGLGPEESLEEVETGAIPASLYAEYYRYGAGVIVLLCLVFLLIIAQLASNAADLWVAYWTNMVETKHNSTTSLLSDDDYTFPSGNSSEIETDDSMIYNVELDNSTEVLPLNDTFSYIYNVEEPTDFIGSRDFYISIYTVFIIAAMTLTPARSWLFYKIFMNASKGLHKKMFSNVLRAPMRFFDTNPSGRILNRFSNDMGAIDELLPRASLDAVQVFMVMSGILMIVFIVSPWMIAPAMVLGLLFYYLRVVYLKSAQDVKRLEGVNRAPVYSHISASLYGMPTIRASNAEKMVIDEFDCLQDQHTGTWYMYIACSEIFGFWLDVISTVFLAFVTYQFLLFQGGNTESFLSGNVGLVISQSLVLTGMLQIGVRQTAEVASNMTSVERVLQYTKLEKESQEHQPTKNLETDWAHFAKITYKNPKRNWPQSGKITFKRTYLRYSPDGEPVLKDLNLEIKPGEKVGIVGRTGAGKSTLIAALFRLAPIEGVIAIDDVDTARVRLNDLRSNISIIPQEPVLFSATVRYNLDPFEKVNDDVLWKALENVEMKRVIESLSQQVCEGGSNFSAGQRQLMCLARAVVRDNKILVMDEATANVDPHTDSLIQKTIRENFKHCTVLTIAHRLNTIMDSDKVLVMDAGRAVEFAHPHLLLQKADGHFTNMVRQTGQNMEAVLRKVAREDYARKFAKKKK